MIKQSPSTFRVFNRPIKRKMDDGGPITGPGTGMDWDNLVHRLSGTQYAVQPVATTPADIAASDPTSGSATLNNVNTNIPLTQSSSLSSRITKAGNAIAPFASNIANEFTTPPLPRQPHLDNMVTIRAPSYASERADVSRQMNADAEAAARSVDGQTGARIRLFNSGAKMDRLSGIYEREANAKLQASNEQARINSSIGRGNNEKLDRYDDQQIERTIAMQRERSANLSNFSDKVVGMQNESAKRDLDLQKTQIMSTMFSRSGVGDRERKILQSMGVADPLGKNYEDIKRLGGFLRNIPIRGQTLKSLYKAPN